jgi:hypothetical protein
MATAKMNIYQKLLEVKKKVPYLQKDKDGHNYSYVTPSNVLATINPILNELGIILKQEVVSHSYERIFQKPKTVDVYISGKKESRVVDVYETMYLLSMKMTWVDVESGEKDENMWFASGVNGDEKGTGSAYTYSERYFMLKYFNIPTDSDDPDSFQEKHLTESQREAIAEEKLLKEIEAVKLLIDKAKSPEELTAIRTKHTICKIQDVKDYMLEKFNLITTPVIVPEEIKPEQILKKKGSTPLKTKKDAIVDDLIEPISSVSPKYTPDPETSLEEILEHETEQVQEVEVTTVESVIAEGNTFTSHVKLAEWGTKNLPDLKSMFTPDEFKQIQGAFRVKYDELELQSKNK